MKKIVCSFFIFCSFGLFAQQIAIEKGDLSFESYEYGQAIRFYNNSLSENPDPLLKQYVYSQLAICYTQLFQYNKAEELYRQVMGSGEEVKPEWYAQYGNVLKLNGKYEEAIQQFIKYRQYSNSADAAGYVQSVEWAMNNDTLANNSYRIYVTNLDVSGQSLGYCYYGSGLIYCHARNKITGKNKRPIFDIDYAITEGNLEFTERGQFFPKLNFEWNEISPSITRDESRIYFAANATRIKKGKVQGALELNKKGIANYKIYVAGKRDAEFQDIQELGFNNNEYNCMHPCILDDGKTLIFSSDKPGGYGGFDLYRSVLGADSMWGEPVNMGPVVNSSENETFPWVNSNLLFFSSKGFNGYGGYDIFVTTLTEQYTPTSLKNMGLPINSFRDDVAYITKDSGGTGYFSSNRNTDNGADQVYFFKEHNAGKLSFHAVSAMDGKNKPEALLPDSITTAPLQRVDQNMMVVYKAEPVTATGSKHTYGQKEQTAMIPVANHTVDDDRADNKTTIPAAQEVKKKTKQPVATVRTAPQTQTPKQVFKPVVKEFPPILFPFNDAAITIVQKQMADSLYTLYKTDPEQHIYVEAYTDSRGSTQYNIGLAKRRAASVKSYLIQKGIPSGKIVTKGFGESELLNECSDGVVCTEEQHAVNRRVVMKLIKK